MSKLTSFLIQWPKESSTIYEQNAHATSSRGSDLNREYWKALGRAAGGARGIVAAIAATAGGPFYDGEWRLDKRCVAAFERR
eukprot:SAG31_NODE_31960_length_362_cov_0.505703_1_plen_81_part_10